MRPWTCPECFRLFAREGQRHECTPALSLEEYFATGPEFERPIFEAVLAELEQLGPMHVEAVSVGIFIKSSGGFVELRPARRWVQLWFPLSRRVKHPRMARKPVWSRRRWYHVVHLEGPDDVDEQVVEWLRVAYLDYG